ncbi:MAG: glycosyltransferase family 2 protein [Caldimicrobium thiodismutans]
MSGKSISIVIPMHNEEGNVDLVYHEVKNVCEEIKTEKGYDYEIIFINDGSTDKTLEKLKTIKELDPKVRILNMDRNRGQAAALTAGFQLARGDLIFTIDGDGQNDPKYLKELLQKLEDGYKVATGYRIKRKEPLLTRKLPSFIANRIIALVTGLKVRDNGCSLKGYVAEIPKRVQIPHGFHRFLPALFGVKNEEVVEIPVLDRKRYWGRSHYGLKRTFEVLRELITFPFLKKSEFYEKFFKIWGYLHIILFVPVAIWFIIKPDLLKVALLLALLSGAIVSYIIHKNLKRFNLSQKEGVFRVEEL